MAQPTSALGQGNVSEGRGAQHTGFFNILGM